MASKREPIRTCVGCRKTFAQGQLTRFTRHGSGWSADPAGQPRQPGRGAYLCSAACAERAAKNKRYPGLATAAEEYGLIVASVHQRDDRHDVRFRSPMRTAN